jgi:hypothetical protein
MTELAVNFYERVVAPTTDINTLLLLEMDGVNDSTNFIDSSGRHTVTAYGTAKLDTAIKKFGSASGSFAGTTWGGNTTYLTIPDSDDWHVLGVRTYEFYLYAATPILDEFGTAMYILSQYSGSGGSRWSISFGRLSSGEGGGMYLLTYFYNGDTLIGDDNLTNINAYFTPNVWHHIAFVWDEATFTMTIYFNSQQIDQYVVNNTALGDATGLLYVGGYAVSPTYYGYNGHLDSLRISNILRTGSSELPINLYERTGLPVNLYERSTGGLPM